MKEWWKKEEAGYFCSWKWDGDVWSKEHKDGAHLAQIVKVVLVMNPLVIGKQTVGLVGDVSDIQTQAVEELSFEKLWRWNRRTDRVNQKHTPSVFSVSDNLWEVRCKKKKIMWEDKWTKQNK